MGLHTWLLLMCIALTSAQLPHPQCTSVLDLAFIVDSSGSIRDTNPADRSYDNWHLALEFISNLVGRLPVSAQGTRVALAYFSNTAHLSFGLDRYTTVDEVQDAVLRLNYAGGNTNTSAGLIVAREQIFKASNGDRPEVPNVAIVITDGYSTYDRSKTVPSAVALRAAGTKVFVIGISSAVKEQELLEISSPPHVRNENYFTSADFQMLDTIVEKVIEQTCRLTTEPPVCSSSLVDLVFVIDSSGSIRDAAGGIANWNLLLQFVVNVISRLEIGPAGAHIGVVRFSNVGENIFFMDSHTDKAELISAVQRIAYIGANTNTSGGIRVMRTEQFVSSRGDRPGVPNIGIVVTDGVSTYDNNLTIPEAEAAREAGIQMYSIGITDKVNEAELKGMSSVPQELGQQYWVSRDFGALDMVVNSLVAEACGGVPHTTTTTPMHVIDKVDLVIILDASSSMSFSSWNLVLSFLSRAIDHLNIGFGQVRVGLVRYSNMAENMFFLNTYHTASALKAAIDHIGYVGSFTNTAAGLRAMHIEQFVAEHGDRAEVYDYALLITGGESNVNQDRTIAEALSAKASGIRIIAVGIGSEVDEAELMAISSVPHMISENYWIMQSYSELYEHLTPIIMQTEVIPQPTVIPVVEMLDLVIILDASSGVAFSDWNVVLRFVTSIIDRLNIGFDKVRVGLVRYSGAAENIFYMNTFYNAEEIKNEILAISYIGSFSNPAGALREMHYNQFSLANGNRNNVADFALLITTSTGNVNQEFTISEAAAVKASGIHILAVGISSGAVEEELRQISSGAQLEGVSYWMVPSLSTLSSYAALVTAEMGVVQPSTTVSPLCEQNIVDLVFVFDNSASVRATNPTDNRYDNWALMLDFAVDIVSHMHIGPHASKVGFVTYSQMGASKFYLDSYINKADVITAIKNLAYAGLGSTNTADGLREMHYAQFNTLNGDRAHVPNVAILVTDGGQSNLDRENSVLEAVAARGDGIHILAVGVTGESDEQILEMVAGVNYWKIEDFNLLGNYVSSLVRETCADVVAPPSTTPTITPTTTTEPTHCIANAMDVVFVLDNSGSIRDNNPEDGSYDNWNLLLQFVSDVIERLTIVAAGTRVGVVSYSHNVHSIFYLNTYTDLQRMLGAVHAIDYIGSFTNTAGGINEMLNNQFTSNRGDRPDVDNLGIVITDGASNIFTNETIPSAMRARNAGVKLLAVGITDAVNVDELRQISSSPQVEGETYWRSADFTRLNSVLDAIIAQTCVPVTSPPVSGDTGATGPHGGTGATGPHGHDGTTGITGAMGETGATGTHGHTGATGMHGHTGATGTSGETGATGSAGRDGMPGSTGLSGATGSSGLPGIGLDGEIGADGQTGATGAHGLDGHSGSTGASGEHGMPGLDGRTGATGYDGETGSTGASGTHGRPGIDGRPGSTGHTGPTGQTGSTGGRGAQGHPGATGNAGRDGVTGLAGNHGETGSTGMEGQTGGTGSAGSPGHTGLSGHPGEAGIDGRTGATGSEGQTGATGFGHDGTTGATGVEGHTGATGEHGQHGQPGIPGTHGRTGATGHEGRKGSTGSTGVMGRDGRTGITGATGVEGHTGSTGQTGYEGRHGSTGHTGPHGRTGSTGQTGFSGIPGATGAPGHHGATGFDGRPGIDGITGATGVSGLDGRHGNHGSTGFEGRTGATGASGRHGVDGFPGEHGEPGQTGSTGRMGHRGNSGTPGVMGRDGVTGATGLHGMDGITGSTGSTGPEGGVGAPGFRGEHGITGATGGVGRPGIDGRTGSTGASGFDGRPGATGEHGQHGNDGLPGLHGSTGLHGPQGLDGRTGATGTAGFPGRHGSNGATGLPGHDGHTGATGRQGSTGTHGFPGLEGRTGATGSHGLDGLHGTPGATGVAGLHGRTGSTGSIGRPGAHGLPGDHGRTGATGRLGAPGHDGRTGATGSAGRVGATGFDGLDGRTGSTGASGVRGFDGSPGARGFDGRTGATGFHGLDGRDGAPGAIGHSGRTGATGRSGIDGRPGFVGATGTAGEGITGSTGSTGLAGRPGSHGFDGHTGATGIHGEFGRTGATGVSGRAGATGLPGFGRTGGTGATGRPGFEGHDGRTGATGNHGLGGLTGATGPAGPPGSGAGCNSTNECLVDNGGCAQLCIDTYDSYHCACANGYTQDSIPIMCPGVHQTCTESMLDLVFVVDSGSIRTDAFANWDLVLHFMRNLVNGLNVGIEKTRVGVVRFADDAHSMFYLNSFDNADQVNENINMISYVGGFANTSGGLREMIENQFKAFRGDRSFVPNVAVVITEGPATVDKLMTIPTADFAHQLDIKVFSVGISTNIDEIELSDISSPPQQKNKNYFMVNDFHELSSISDALLGEMCTELTSENLYCKETVADNQCFCTRGHCNIKSVNSTQCSDINECLWENGGCQHSCINLVGSYRCECSFGFRLHGDHHTCADIDECDANPCVAGQLCANTYGSYVCINQGGASGLVQPQDQDIGGSTNGEAASTSYASAIIGACVLSAVIGVVGAVVVGLAIRQARKMKKAKATRAKHGAMEDFDYGTRPTPNPSVVSESSANKTPDLDDSFTSWSTDMHY